jgi:multidrug efflux pump subunit AcrB
LKIVDNQLYSVVISTYPDNLSGNLINKLQILKENIQQIPVFYSSGSVVRIKDIAQVKVDAPFFKKLSYVDGLPAVTYKIYKNPGIDMPLLVEKIKGYLTSKHKYFEENNLKLVYTYSRLDDIRRVFNTFLENFWQTSLIILGVLFLFLGFRYAF